MKTFKKNLLALALVLVSGTIICGLCGTLGPASRAATYNVYLGDLHSHTGYSDGTGTPADAFSMAKSSGRGDFLAITDHHDKSWVSTDYQISPAEWADMNAQADAYTDGSFVGIAAYEMTQNVWGHMNTFNTDLIDDVTTVVVDYYDLLVARPGSLAQWNHPTKYSDNFEDYAYLTPERDARVNLLEVVNGTTVREASYTMALDAGWHVAPSANSDTHSANWLTGYEVRTGVLASSLTRANIFDAIQNHRAYATQDRNLEITFEVNGSIMGSILSSPADCGFSIHVEDPDTGDTNDRIATIDIIKDGGVVAATHSPNAHTVDWNPTLTASGVSYYHLRVTNAGGQRAWTAPVWITSAPAPTDTPGGPTATPAPPTNTPLPTNTPDPSNNLVVNPGFETGSLSPWGQWNDVSVVDNNQRSGDYCLRVGNGPASSEQSISGLTPSATYTLTGWGKMASGSSGSFMIGVKDYGGSQLVQMISSTSYVQKSIEFTMGSSNTTAKIFCFRESGTGYAYCDDFSVLGGSAGPTDTPAPPTDTPIPPTDTPIPPTDTPAPPTDTPAPQYMHVGDITMSYKAAGPNISARATVTILDAGDQPVGTATVYGEFTGATSSTPSGDTAGDGTVTLESPKKKNGGTWTFCVTNVVKSGWTYDDASNVETCDQITAP